MVLKRLWEGRRQLIRTGPGSHSMRFCDMPSSDRPRERLERKGASCLSSIELLAVLLGAGGVKKDVLQLASSILNEFKDPSGLSKASLSELCSLTGIGKAKASILLAAIELGRRASVSDLSAGDGENWKKALSEWVVKLASEEREYIVSIYIDEHNRTIACDRISYGGPDGAFLDSGFFLRRCVRLDSKGVVLLHNHPDGGLDPSNDDIILTEFLFRKLTVLDVKLLGHFICANGSYSEIKTKL